MNSAALNLVLGHAIGSLPDSLSERKKLLTAALELLPADHPLRVSVGEMLHWLIAHEEHQLQLAMDFPKLATPIFKPDGNGPAQSPLS
jgi:hypothetical protein